MELEDDVPHAWDMERAGTARSSGPSEKEKQNKYKYMRDPLTGQHRNVVVERDMNDFCVLSQMLLVVLLLMATGQIAYNVVFPPNVPYLSMQHVQQLQRWPSEPSAGDNHRYGRRLYSSFMRQRQRHLSGLSLNGSNATNVTYPEAQNPCHVAMNALESFNRTLCCAPPLDMNKTTTANSNTTAKYTAWLNNETNITTKVLCSTSDSYLLEAIGCEPDPAAESDANSYLNNITCRNAKLWWTGCGRAATQFYQILMLQDSPTRTFVREMLLSVFVIVVPKCVGAVVFMYFATVIMGSMADRKIDEINED
jgi:hypothetical protein